MNISRTYQYLILIQMNCNLHFRPLVVGMVSWIEKWEKNVTMGIRIQTGIVLVSKHHCILIEMFPRYLYNI